MFNLPKIEQEVLKNWQKDNTFAKSLAKDSVQGEFVFYDGPPFATGLPHYGHLVASLIKDIVPRYFTMKGYHVERRWGWDTHGLPIENIVEKELGLEAKKDIIEYGVDKFNKACHSKVMLYRDEWRKTIERFGRWADMDNDYKTMDLDYMESVWWVFRQLWDKGLIYEDYKSMHICPRCETTLSQSEVTEGYKQVKDLSVTAKFKIKNPEKLPITRNANADVYLLAWTTTPWTLPGNVALAVGEDIEYIALNSGKEIYVVAAKAHAREESLEKLTIQVFQSGPTIKGSELVGLKYEPLFDYYSSQDNLENKDNGWQVYAGDFVTTEEGTGVVHIAPAFGQDDMDLGKEKNLPFVQHIGMDGHFAPEVKDFAGLHVKPKDDHMATDIKILKYLAKHDLVYSKEKYEHPYPHCWRCDTPLLNYATSSWFVAVTKIKKEILKNAESITWMPAHIKTGRWGNWLEGARDWSISRQRFWGSVIPLWKCAADDCDEIKVIGSIEELEKLSGEKITDMHKHIMDKITFPCEKCPSASSGQVRTMKRIPDVIDCWFESGSMPYAQEHYPFENKQKFESNFPAQFIAEGADQTRAWFYYMHVLATAVRKCNAFENVVVNGIVLAEDGKKMSKKLQNYPEPDVLFDKYGADAVRYYLATSSVVRADDLRFSEAGVAEKSRMFVMLLNVVNIYKMYAPQAQTDADKTQISADKMNLKKEDLVNVLDIWITAKLNELTAEVTERLDNYDLQGAARLFEVFIDELSTWYIRRSRDRFKGTDQEDKQGALKTLRHVILNLTKLMAPFTPFVADHIYANEMQGDMSVHLKDWPEPNFEKEIKKSNVLEKMQLVRDIVEMGLAKRDEAKIPVRQPLQKLQISNCKFQIEAEYIQLIKDELNIKEAILRQAQDDKSAKMSVELDTIITEELKLEGIKRDLVRQINNLRKKQGLTIQDKVKLGIATDSSDIKKVLELYKDDILKSTLASEISDDLQGKSDEIKIGDNKIKINLTK